VGDVRGKGMMYALELVADKLARRPFPRADRKAEALTARCFEHGLVVYPGTGCATGTEGDLVMVAPPFVITEEQVEELVALLERSLTELEL
jgi:adenosylmethionine-8-amino-7-oxononanoate aminotransferase